MVTNTDFNSFLLGRSNIFTFLAPYVQLPPYIHYVESIIRKRILFIELFKISKN